MLALPGAGVCIDAMPHVSVIMVAHRDTPYLRPAIRSVLEQTWRDLELVLVDNGIGLREADLGEPGADERLRMVSLESNRGIATGINAAVSQCRGDYVALLDSDDIALPDRIARQVAAMHTRPELGMLFMAARTIDRDDRVIGTEFTLITEDEHRLFGSYDMPAVTPTYMCRREVMEQHVYREGTDVASDYDFFTRVNDQWPTGALPEYGICYRRYEEQSTVARRAVQVLGANIVRLVTARRRAGREERFSELIDEYRGWLESPPDAGTQYATFARRSLREKFPLLAVYFARKSLATLHGVRWVFRALGTLVGAIICKPDQTILLLRLFFTGPLRTFGLRPFVADTDS